MKTFKVFIQVLLVVILLSLLLTVFASAQSDRKINRNSQETGLYIRATFGDKIDEVYNEKQLYCEEALVTHFINNRHFIAHTSKFQLDIDVKDRKVGKYNSWVGKDRDNDNYYFITPFTTGGVGYGVIIQPVTKKLVFRYDEPVITIANVKICQ